LLLLVGGLYELGVLSDMIIYLRDYCDTLSTYFLGEKNEFWQMVLLIYLLGIISAVVDNVALTAIAIVVLGPLHLAPILWALVAVAVGIGGNLFIYGSLAGIMMAMKLDKVGTNEEEKILPLRHLRENFIPSFASYNVAFFGVLIWYWLLF
jgi:Na+/H+ antiporter NhaD/arsenite permease-like protein